MFRCRAREIIRGNTHRRKRERNLQRASIYTPHMHADQRSTRIKYTAVLGRESYACIQANAPLTALAWLPFLILCVQTRSKRLIKIPRRHSRFTRTQVCLRSVGARKHNCPRNTLNHRRRHLTHAASKARNVSSARNASAYST